MPVCGRRTALQYLKTCIFLICLLPVTALAEALSLTKGIQQDYQTSGEIERVAVGDPEVLEVTVTGANQLLITPQQAGTTSLKIWTASGRDDLEVTVSASEKNLQHQLDQMGADYRLDAAGDKVQISGDIKSLEEHAAVRNTLGDGVVDRAEFAHDAQVQIDIKVVEVNRNKLQSASAGLSFIKPNSDRIRGVTPPGGSLLEPGGIREGLSGLADGDGFNFSFGRIKGNGEEILGVLSILESNGFAYTLAEPSLMAMSGQSANFLAGGEFPVPVRGGGFDNSVTIEYKEFGVRVSLTPTVLDDQRIALKVAPEVSELDFSAGIETAGVTVPALRVRRTDTSVALGDGESFVISGLVSRNTIANVDKLPGLGDIPVLGAFFRSNVIDREDKELLMIVTPRLVRPIARDAELPALPGEKYRDYDPGFAEFLFLEDGRFADRPPVSSGFSK